MKNTILINLFVFLFSISPGYAGKFPNIPAGINVDTYCDAKGGSYGHVIVVLDLTTKLNEARIEFIKDQVFSKEFYLRYSPFTKFSYILINNKEPTKQKFLFSKCRPKTGNKNFSKNEKATLFENAQVLESFSNRFFKSGNDLYKEIFSQKHKSDWSEIYETIAHIFQKNKADFNANHPKRHLVLVSDLMQHTTRLSFYKACNAKSDKAVCPSFKDFMYNLSDKDYILATSPNGTGINLQMIYLNNRCETNKALDKSLNKMWFDYFTNQNFKVLKTIRQVDLRNC